MSAENIISPHIESELKHTPALVVISDLDDTILGADKRFDQAQETLGVMRAHGVPLSPNTSKVLKEIEMLLKAMGLWEGNYSLHPFISENSQIYIPKKADGKPYFDVDLAKHAVGHAVREIEGFDVIELGPPIEQTRQVLATAANNTGIDIVTTQDPRLTPEIFSQYTGVSVEQAKLALQRKKMEISVLPDVLTGKIAKSSPEALAQYNALGTEIGKLSNGGLAFMDGGKFRQTVEYTTSSKGPSAGLLAGLYREHYRNRGGIEIAVFGDAEADFPMFPVGDRAYLVASLKTPITPGDLRLSPNVTHVAHAPHGFPQGMSTEFQTYFQRRNQPDVARRFQS